MKTEREGHPAPGQASRAPYEKPEVRFVELRPEVLQVACGKTPGAPTCRGNPRAS